ncbi:MAG: hypothetical protein JRN68_03120 [Nitrososphaerota archaeon]|jgi:hypothetical protein|nr:hypothetical protein [Nitrososphaerota archaeon]
MPKKRYSFATLAVFVSLISLVFTMPAFAAPTSATFEGTGSTHVVAKVISTGEIVTLNIPTSFTVTVTPGGPGVGTLALTITLEGITTMAADGGAHDTVGTGQIRITATSVTGGGTLNNNPTGYMSQFGFGVTSQNGNVEGQFQCQNTGRSASVMDMPLSMLLGEQVDVLQMTVHGTVTTLNIG